MQKGKKITVTLSWTGRGDLDLYAFYVLKNGTTGKVYYRDKGSAQAVPYITLSGDSRKAGKETAIIHLPEALAHVVSRHTAQLKTARDHLRDTSLLLSSPMTWGRKSGFPFRGAITSHSGSRSPPLT